MSLNILLTYNNGSYIHIYINGIYISDSSGSVNICEVFITNICCCSIMLHG